MSGGHWRDSTARWFELEMRYCAACGQLVPGRVWEVTVAGEARIFCAPACETLFRDYLERGKHPLTERGGVSRPPLPRRRGDPRGD